MALLDNVTTITGKLVTLRPISREDYPTLFKWRSSFDTVHMLNFKRRVASYEEFVRDVEALLPNAMLLLVREKRQGTPIGYVLAHSINPWDGWLAVGMYVEEQYHHRGHGGETALLSLDLLFRTFPIRKVMAEVYDFAEALERMLRALGFEQVGYVPDHYWHENQSWGLRYMSLTRDAWETKRERFTDVIAVQSQYAELTQAGSDGRGV